MTTFSSILMSLMVISCASLRSYKLHVLRSHIRVNRHLSGGRSIQTKLDESYAVGSSISIAPTVYREDLYDVLGLSLNATKVELRDAYWAIAFKTHPDRNDTPEALCEFRNASYAYKVLGRSEKTRSDYDSKYRTKLYIESMDQLSRDVIAPFAMEVAMPLLNMTVRGIGSFAVPFFKDAFEQSSALFQAAFTADESMVDDDEEFTGFEAITRAATAAIKTNLEQRIRRTNDSIVSTSARLINTDTQLKEAIEKEGETLEVLGELKRIDDEDRSSLKNIISEIELAKESLRSAEVLANSKEEEYARQTASVAGLLVTAALLSEARSIEDEEISRLEALLTLAKEKNRNTVIKQTTLDINISAETRTKEVLEAFFVVASTEKIRQTEALVEIERDCEALIIKSAQSTRDMLEKSVVAEKQTYLRTSLERKNAQLNMKKNELGIQLRNLESEWSVKENDANFERNRILQKKKEAADKIIENKRIENDLEEIREMESNIRRREREVEMMEIERNRLVQLENIEREKLREDEISEILKRADDISTKNSNTNTNTTTPPNTFPGKQKSSNPFSRKEKYVYKKKEEVVVDINKKVETLELKKKEEYMFKRSNNDYLNLENFYTI